MSKKIEPLDVLDLYWDGELPINPEVLVKKIGIKLEKKDAIITALEKLSGLKKDVDKAMSKDIIFENDGEKFLKALLTLKYEIKELQDLKFSQICYVKIFNQKTEELLKEKDFINQLSNYIDIYNRLIKTSTFFKNGVCDHDNASDISKNLIKNNFFRAEHSIFLSGEITPITTEQDLEKRIETEKSQILENKELTQAFNKIANRLDKNEQCREFRDYIKDKQFIIPELMNIAKFKRNLWISYLINQRDLYNELIDVYDQNQPKLNEIFNKIDKEQSKWQLVVDKFNKRFFVPFKLDIENRTDAVLGKKTPNIVFIFDDKLVEKDKITQAKTEFIFNHIKNLKNDSHSNYYWELIFNSYDLERDLNYMYDLIIKKELK